MKKFHVCNLDPDPMPEPEDPKPLPPHPTPGPNNPTPGPGICRNREMLAYSSQQAL